MSYKGILYEEECCIVDGAWKTTKQTFRCPFDNYDYEKQRTCSCYEPIDFFCDEDDPDDVDNMCNHLDENGNCVE